MLRFRRLGCALLALSLGERTAFAQAKTYTWPELRERFQTTNPTLRAGELNIDEARAQEITAHLRPNPDFTALLDQVNIFPDPAGIYPWRPFGNVIPAISGSYLHERQHKRELRTESAQKNTAITISQQADLERNLLFNLRTSFVQTLQQKAILGVTRESLTYYDKVLSVSRDRFKAGDIAQVDLDRLELQRVQFESDVQTATVNLRTAKIQLLQLLNDRTPVEQFDVTGAFDFPDQIEGLEEYRNIALQTRPDLKAAVETVAKARTDHRLAIANGSTDPTIGVDFGRNPPVQPYIGFSVNIPLRIFDRNQGEKLRTQLDITRNEKLRDANLALVYSDVDSAHATIESNLTLLRPYKKTYLGQAARVRETISFSYERGGASLLDFLQSQQDYRSIQVTYLNLVGAYLNAANQLNMAVGREVLQ